MKMAPTGAQGVALLERIKKRGIVGAGVAFLEEVCHWAGRL